MPSKSKAQHNLMAMVATNPPASKRLGISQSVGREFMEADKGKHFSKTVSKRKANDKLGYQADKVAGTPGRQPDY
jgi:hypothetical protein